MKCTVVTTITSTYDIDTNEADHSVEIDDRDALSQIHRGLFNALLNGAVKSTALTFSRKFPSPEAKPVETTSLDDLIDRHDAKRERNQGGDSDG